VTVAEAEREFEGKGYGDFKVAVGETVASLLKPVRENYAHLSADMAYLEECYSNGARAAERISQKIVGKVYKKIGYLPKT
jgi:tryptophanyl-tRNA synthetase